MEGGFLSPTDPFALHVLQLAAALGHATVVRKGPIDVASDGRTALFCCREGAPRRCGGRGDVLTGAIGTVLAWTEIARKRKTEESKGPGKNDGGEREERGKEREYRYTPPIKFVTAVADMQFYISHGLDGFVKRSPSLHPPCGGDRGALAPRSRWEMSFSTLISPRRPPLLRSERHCGSHSSTCPPNCWRRAD
jgi:hypothetical protein